MIANNKENNVYESLPNSGTNSERTSTNASPRPPSTPIDSIIEGRSNAQKQYSFIILLVVNIFERFAYYGLLCNFVLFLNTQPLFWESYNASIVLFIFIGITHLLSVIGGWIADAFLGRYGTICLSFFIYIIGYAAFPLMSYYNSNVPGFCHYDGNRTSTNSTPVNNSMYYSLFGSSSVSIIREPCSWVVLVSIIALGVGVGFMKSNIGAFGAEQVSSQGPNKVFKYFNWLYWCINFGSLISLSGLGYMQQNYSFFYGYIIPFGCLVLAFLMFAMSKMCYFKRNTEVSVLSNIFKVIINAFKVARNNKKLSTFSQHKKMSDEISNSEDYTELLNYSKTSFLDNAKIRYGGTFDEDLVEDVKALRSIVLLFALLVPYWILYFQIETTFLVQGIHMKLLNKTFNNGLFTIPAAWLSIADQIIIIILIPILDRIIYPCMKKILGYEISTKTRMAVGMIFSATSVAFAGLVESKRLNIILNNSTTPNYVTQYIDNQIYNASNFSILWQIPQYTFVGIGEVFCSIAGLYFAYTAAPKSMQSIIMGLFYLFMGIGSFLGSAILYAFHTLIYSKTNADDINCRNCHLDIYFYFLACLQLLGLILFLIIDSKYSITKINESPDKQTNTSNPVKNILRKRRFNYRIKNPSSLNPEELDDE